MIRAMMPRETMISSRVRPRFVAAIHCQAAHRGHLGGGGGELVLVVVPVGTAAAGRAGRVNHCIASLRSTCRRPSGP